MTSITRLYRFSAVAITLSIVVGLALAGRNTSASQVINNGVQILVTSLSDSSNGVCPDVSNCTLRAAINQANQSKSATTIKFNLSGVIILNSLLGTLGIGNNATSINVTVDGSGQSIVIDGDKKGGVVAIQGQPSTITLNALTIQNSYGNHVPAPGVLNLDGILTISNSLITKNTIGVVNSNGTVLIINSVLIDNSTAGLGGAIYNFGEGRITIANSTISNNQAGDVGGGIYNDVGNVFILSSIIAHNTANRGPDVYGNFISLGHNVIGNGTDSSFLINYSATATYSAANPQSNPGLSTITASGAGHLTALPAYGYVTLTPSIMPPGFVPSLTSTPLPDMQNSSTDQVGTAASPIDPMLGPLAANGGSTLTLALLPGSPAIRKGDCGGNANVNPPIPAATTDQRGVPRGSPCSIGAFEGSAVAVPAGTITATPGS